MCCGARTSVRTRWRTRRWIAGRERRSRKLRGRATVRRRRLLRCHALRHPSYGRETGGEAGAEGLCEERRGASARRRAAGELLCPRDSRITAAESRNRMCVGLVGKGIMRSLLRHCRHCRSFVGPTIVAQSSVSRDADRRRDHGEGCRESGPHRGGAHALHLPAAHPDHSRKPGGKVMCEEITDSRVSPQQKCHSSSCLVWMDVTGRRGGTSATRHCRIRMLQRRQGEGRSAEGWRAKRQRSKDGEGRPGGPGYRLGGEPAQEPGG